MEEMGHMNKQIQQTNPRGGDQPGREGNASHPPHHLGSPSHSRPSNICWIKLKRMYQQQLEALWSWKPRR